MRRTCRRWAVAMLAVCATAACAQQHTLPQHTLPPELQQVPYPAKQEVVPDFGRFVPQREAPRAQAAPVALQRVTAAVPWGRGLAMIDGALIVLSRGRHRNDGGVSQEMLDHAGTLWKVDPSLAEPVVPGEWAGQAVRENAQVFAAPAQPPMYRYRHDRPAEQDTMMTRPYCALAYDAASQNLYVCAFAGAELPAGFRKHATDGVYRYDLRTGRWHVVEQHDPRVVPPEALGAVVPNVYYPHQDPAANPPPHGWLNGPNGCAAVGKLLYVPAKDNHLVVAYDLGEIRDDPAAGPPAGRPVLGPYVMLSHPGGREVVELLGPCGVAPHGGWLYVSYRTSGVVVRVPLDEAGYVKQAEGGYVEAQLIGVFEGYDALTKRTGNLYDITLSAAGDLYVSMGTEGRVWRVTPDPAAPFYGHDQTARPTTAEPFLDMTALTGRKTGVNNIFAAPDGYLYVSSRANDRGEGNVHGTVYRARMPR